MAHAGIIWDQDLIDAIYIDEVAEGLILTLIDGRDNSMAIALPPDRIRELRLLLQRYEREHK
jgi:hypothetical protein